MAAADDGSGAYYMSASVAEQYQLLAATQNVLQYKRCNCKKAKCLKLYCVCFAAGVYCQNCNCLDCSNVPEKSELVMTERQRVLQREPMAFTTKVMGPAHLRGCKCKRSRCVKKYCDCFDAQVRCSDMCKCKDCQNQPDNYNGSAAATAAATAGAPSMNIPLGPQHHAMLMAMQQQQQQQQAEYDPAALARLQLFGSAGFPPEGLEAAAAAAAAAVASQGAGGSQPPSRAASPGLAAFLPAASQAFAAGAAAGAAVGLQYPPLPGLPHPAAAAAAAAVGSQGVAAGDLSTALHAASQEIALSQAPQLLHAHSQPLMYQLGHFGAFTQQEQGHWQQLVLDQQQQQQQDDADAWPAVNPAAAAAAAEAGDQEVERGMVQDEQGADEPGMSLVVADGSGEVRITERYSDPGVATQDMQHAHGAPPRRGSSAPVVAYNSAAAAAAAAAAAVAAAGAPAAASGGRMHRSASMGAEDPRMQESTHPRASSLPPPDAAAAMHAAAQASAGAARGVRRSLQQQQQHSLPRNGSAAAMLEQLDSAAAYSAELAADIATAELPPPAAAAAGGVAGQGLYAPYRITKVQPLVYAGAHPALAAVSAAGAAVAAGAVVEGLEPEMQEAYGADDCDPQEPHVQAGQIAGREGQPGHDFARQHSMRQHSGMLQGEADAEAATTAGAESLAVVAPAATDHLPAAAAGGNNPEQDGQGPVYSSTEAAAAAANPEAAAAAAASVPAAAVAADPDADAAAAAAAGALGPMALTGMLDDPAAAGVLAAKLGLCDNVQQAAINAAKFLRDILNLSRLAAGPEQPTGSFTGSQQQPLAEDPQAGEHQQPGAAANGQGAATPAFSAGGVSATHEHQPQPGSRLRHSSSAVHAAARPAGSLLASASLGHWGTTNTPASKAAAAAAGAGGGLGSGMSPAVSAGSDMHQQQRQQHVVASTPQCAPPGHAVGAAGAAAAAAGVGQGTGVTSAGSVSFAKSLGGGVYAPGAGGITPLPLAAAHAPGVRINSCLRGPSPLGPVGFNRDAAAGFTRETAGLQALLGPQARDRQLHGSQQEGTPGGAGGAAASGGGPGSAARRSMQLLPGSFRLGVANNNSPGVGSPAVAAALAHSGALHAAADSPAGSVSLAPSIASAVAGATAGTAAAAAAGAEPQEQTPVYSNAQKQPCGMYDAQQQQQQQQQQQEQHYEHDQHMGEEDGIQAGGMDQEGGAVADDAVLLPPNGHPGSNTTPVPASAAALAAAGAAALAVAASMPTVVHTPLSAALEALGAAVAAPTPAHQLQQQAQQMRADTAAAGGRAGSAAAAAEGMEAAAGVQHLFGAAAGGATNLQDMTPSSLFIASLLAANRTPTDMFLTSPLPPIGSALRQAGLGSAGPLSALHPSALVAGSSGGAARLAHADAAGVGVGIALRGGQVTPLSLHGLHGAAGNSRQTPGSDLAAAGRGGMPKRNSRGGRGGGLGVGALCTGILRGSAAEASPEPGWARGQQEQLDPAAVAGSSGAAAAAAAAGAAAGAIGGSSGEQQEDAAASGMKPDTDKAAARAAAAAADTAAGAAAAVAAGLTSPGTAAGVGSLLAAANYISTPRDATLSARGRPLSGEDAATDCPAAKRQRLNSGGTPAGSGGSKEGCGRGGGGASLQEQQHLSPALFKPAPGSSAAAGARGQAEQDTKAEVDAPTAAAADEGAGVMHPPRQQQQRHRQHSGPSGHRAHAQKQLSALQQLLQVPAASAAAAGAGPAAAATDDMQEGAEAADADAWNEWRRQQEQGHLAEAAVAAAAAGVKAGAVHLQVPKQQLQQGHAQVEQGQQHEDMKSPPVPAQRPDIQGQGAAGRDRSPSMESYAAADAMLALCKLQRFGQASTQQQ